VGPGQTLDSEYKDESWTFDVSRGILFTQHLSEAAVLVTAGNEHRIASALILSELPEAIFAM